MLELVHVLHYFSEFNYLIWLFGNVKNMFGYFFGFFQSVVSAVAIIYLSVIFLANTSASLVSRDVQVVTFKCKCNVAIFYLYFDCCSLLIIKFSISLTWRSFYDDSLVFIRKLTNFILLTPLFSGTKPRQRGNFKNLYSFQQLVVFSNIVT